MTPSISHLALRDELRAAVIKALRCGVSQETVTAALNDVQAMMHTAAPLIDAVRESQQAPT